MIRYRPATSMPDRKRPSSGVDMRLRPDWLDVLLGGRTLVATVSAIVPISAVITAPQPGHFPGASAAFPQVVH
jgi:hypothetical protein